MNSLVKPGALFMQRLRLLPKFALVSALFLIPLLLVSTLLFSELNKAIEATHRERDGLAAIRLLGDFTQLLQQHRALRHMALAGNADADAQAGKVRAALGRKLAGIDSQSFITQAGKAAAIADIRRDWSDIENNISTAKQKDSYTAHTNIIALLGSLMSSLADASGLTLDPDVDSYHLTSAIVGTFPLVADNLFEIAGRGAAYIDTGLLEPNEDLLLHSSVTVAKRDLTRIPGQFEAVFSHNPSLRTKLEGHLDAALSVDAFLDRARSEVLSSLEQTSGNQFYGAGAKSIEALHATSGAAADVLDTLLMDRVERAALRRNLLAMAVLASVLLAAYLLYGFYASFSHEFGKLEQAIVRAKSGDLATSVSSRAKDEIGNLVNSFANMNSGLMHLVREVRGSSEAITGTSYDLATDSMALSARTESQASSLEQTASAMKEMTDVVRRNGNNAKRAHEIVLSSARVADRGGESVRSVIATMGGIRESSCRIMNIIEMIDGIAFQTNILALNAAVEAARAGEQGRGFAVVATEVRALAQRSASASKEIKSLIQTSFEQVENGSRLADSAGATMKEVLDSVADLTRIMNDIAAAAREQTQGIEQINEAIGLVGEATQHNAALGEHAAAASASLKDQATRLSGAVAAFKLDAESQQPFLDAGEALPDASTARVARLRTEFAARQTGWFPSRAR